MNDTVEKIRGMFARTLESEGPEPRFIADEMLEELRRERDEAREQAARLFEASVDQAAQITMLERLRAENARLQTLVSEWRDRANDAEPLADEVEELRRENARLRLLIRSSAMEFATWADAARDNSAPYDGGGWDMAADAYDNAAERLLDRLRALNPTEVDG